MTFVVRVNERVGGTAVGMKNRLRMKIRPGPLQSPWGPTLPVRLVPVTTEDDDLEERAVDWLQLYYFPDGIFDTHAGRAWPLRGGSHLRPDIVTLIAGTAIVVFVGDAKRHKRLQKRSVEKVRLYQQTTNAENAGVFIPRSCNVDKTAQAYADSNGIAIVRL